MNAEIVLGWDKIAASSTVSAYGKEKYKDPSKRGLRT
jgi:hypothetical protein